MITDMLTRFTAAALERLIINAELRRYWKFRREIMKEYKTLKRGVLRNANEGKRDSFYSCPADGSITPGMVAIRYFSLKHPDMLVKISIHRKNGFGPGKTMYDTMIEKIIITITVPEPSPADTPSQSATT